MSEDYVYLQIIKKEKMKDKGEAFPVLNPSKTGNPSNSGRGQSRGSTIILK